MPLQVFVLGMPKVVLTITLYRGLFSSIKQHYGTVIAHHTYIQHL